MSYPNLSGASEQSNGKANSHDLQSVTVTTPVSNEVRFFVHRASSDEQPQELLDVRRLHAHIPRRKDTDQVPNIEFYKSSLAHPSDVFRPTLEGLRADPSEADILEHGIQFNEENSQADLEFGAVTNNEVKSKVVGSPKFGWIQGVLVRCFLNIVGVMLYLRLTWVAAQAGIGLGSVIILMSSLVTTLTTLSMCAICTNGEVKGGGAYFIISRSLGPEFGGSIGVIFAFANAVAVAMHTVGFAETVVDLLISNGVTFLDNSDNAQRVIAIGAALLLLTITQIGMEWEAKAQNVFLITLAASVVDYVVGTFLPPSPQQVAQGFVGYSGSVFKQNFVPMFRNGETFFSVFGVYFPSATGILAGANISGDLKDPQKDIPKGTLLAILLTTVMYCGFIWLSGSSVNRYAPGLENIQTTAAIYGTSTYATATTDLMTCNVDDGTGSCTSGLMLNFQTCSMQSAFSYLVTAGIFAASLSSALAALVSAPKIFQAVCRDRLFPYIGLFGRGYFSKHDEPRLAYILAFLIATAMILVGSLNAIAPIISNFYLATYALINFATFDASFADSPGFRPSFKYYNKWISLFGAALCVAGMFVINWWTALITFVIIGALYVYVLYRRPDVNWGSSSQAHMYRSALKSMLKLQQMDEHVKNYRPQILCLTGNPTARPGLIDFVCNITKGQNLLICGHVIINTPDDSMGLNLNQLRFDITDWFLDRKIRGFYHPVVQSDFRAGVQALVTNAGLSKLRPNIILFGFKSDWQSCSKNELQDYFNLIHDAFDAKLAVCMLRSPNGFDIGGIVEENVQPNSGLNLNEGVLNKGYFDSAPDLLEYISDGKSRVAPLAVQIKNPVTMTGSHSDKQLSSLGYKKQMSVLTDHSGTVTSRTGTRRRKDKEPIKQLFRRLTKPRIITPGQFKTPVKNGQIDVWWLFDDGGLNILLPHLLTKTDSYLEGAKLRIFTLSSSADTIEEDKKNMAALLSKFRIQAELHVLPDMHQDPKAESVSEFEAMIDPYREIPKLATYDTSDELRLITDDELMRLKTKTNRQLRIRELLLEHSSGSSLIVLTMLVPRKNGCSAALYMAWLDFVTRDLSPVLFVRGNQEAVLTFYS